MSRLTTWRQEIAEEMKEHGETWADIVSTALPPGGDLGTEFDAGYGGSDGCHFTVWTKKRVYFPVVYDGAEWVGSVARKPDGVPTKHFGGE